VINLPGDAAQPCHYLDRLKHDLESVSALVLGLDLDGRIALINHAGCQLLEWSEQELLGRPWIETCLPPDTRAAIHTKFARLVAGDCSLVVNPIVTKSGNEIMIEWHNTVLVDDRGYVVGTLSFGMSTVVP
jgi:PAS domain S-box-containing protein